MPALARMIQQLTAGGSNFYSLTLSAEHQAKFVLGYGASTPGGGFIAQSVFSEIQPGRRIRYPFQYGSPPLTPNMPDDKFPVFSASLAIVTKRCWEKAAPPAEWSLTFEQFERALEASVAHRFPDAAVTPTSQAATTPDVKALQSYLESLHLADLALACACSAGSAAAWDFFVVQFRPELYRSARAIAGESGARDLADSLHAELYGLRELEGRRKSLFDYFHGRSKLGTWLRAILAQRHVDALRRSRRWEPLEDSEEGACSEPRALTKDTAPDPEREKYLAMMQAIVTRAIDGLDPRDRLRLAYYYADERTLAAIGKLLGEHEATVSRKLDRTRRRLRKWVETALRDERKLSEAQMRQCFEYARDEWPFDLTGPLSARD